MTDYNIDVVPGVIWDDLNTFNVEHLEGKMKIEHIEGKHILITLPEEEGVSQELVVKVKFIALADPEETGNTRYRVKFMRKRGDLDKWYSIFKDMKDAVLEDILIAPEQPIVVE